MAKVVEGNPGPWKATIRCAQGTYLGKFTTAVKGCYALLEIEAEDLVWTVDSDGDGTLHCKCPACGMTLYPEWQLSRVPESVYERSKRRR